MTRRWVSAEAWMRQVAAAEANYEARFGDAGPPLPTTDPPPHPTLPAPPTPTGPPSRRHS